MSPITSLRSMLLIFDPGYMNLRSSVRGTAAVVITYFCLAYIAKTFQASSSLPFLGVLMALLSTIVVTDDKVKDQKNSHLLLILPTISAASISVLLTDFAYARLTVFLIFTFIAVSIRRYGLRYSGMGTIVFMAYFATLFFPFRVMDIPFIVGAITLSILMSFAFRFWVIPDRPPKLLTLYTKAFDLRVDQILLRLSRALHSSGCEARANRYAEPSKDWKNVRQSFVQANELSLTIEHFFDVNTGASIKSRSNGFRLKAFEQEVALRRLWDYSYEFLHFEQVPLEIFIEASKVVSILRARKIDLQPLVKELDGRRDVVNVQPFLIAVKDVHKTLINQEFKAEDLSMAIEEINAKDGYQTRLPNDAKTPHTILSRLDNLHANTRQAIQATIATALASILGTTISPQRWYWASVAAFTVFIGATRGETMMRAVLRVVGTVVGLLLGFALASACSGKQGLEWTLIVICVFFGIFGARMTFGFWTASLFSSMFALLYDILGLLSDGIVVLRMEETLIGAAIGVVVAALVLPTSTHTVIRSALHQYLSALSELIKSLPEELSPSPFSRRKLIRNLRNMDKDLLAVRTASLPVVGKGSLMKHNSLPSAIHDATMLAHYLRHLAIHVDPKTEMDSEEFASSCQTLGERFIDVAEAIKRGETIDRIILPWSGNPSRNMSGPNHSLERIRVSLASLASRKL